MDALRAWLEQYPVLDFLGGNLLEVLLYPFAAGQRIYWIYLATAFLGVVWVYLHAAAKEGRGLRGFLRFCFPAEIWRTKSAWLDVRYFFVHQIVRVWIYGGFRIAVMIAAYEYLAQTLVDAFGAPESAQPITWTDRIVVSLFVAFAGDFGAFLVHYLQHKIAFLWEFHKVHHSLEVMHPLSNYREHPVDNFAYAAVGGVVGGAAVAGVYFLRGQAQVPMVEILGVNAITFVFNAAGYNLRHSHVWIAWPKKLGWILASPAYHQIHHSARPEHIDRNLAFMFPVWDWMFRTLHMPRTEPEEMQFGLGDGTEGEYRSMLRLYFIPFYKLFRRFLPAR